MKRALLILSIILTTTFVQAQSSNGPEQNGRNIVRLYPNPATSFINFEFQKNFEQGYSIQVYNFLGRKMYESSNITARTNLSLSEYNRGVYFYQLRDRSGKMVESGKFQVAR